MEEQSAPVAREGQEIEIGGQVDPEKKIREFAELVYYSQDVATSLTKQVTSLNTALTALQASRGKINDSHKKYVDEKLGDKLNDLRHRVDCAIPCLESDLGVLLESAQELIRALDEEIKSAWGEWSKAKNDLAEVQQSIKELTSELTSRQKAFDGALEYSKTLKVKFEELSKLEGGIKGETSAKRHFKAYATAIEIKRRFDEEEVLAPSSDEYLDQLIKDWASIVAVQQKVADATQRETDLKGKVQKYTKILHTDLKDRISVLVRRWGQEHGGAESLAAASAGESSEEVPEWGTVTSL
ncbi:MAG: hypothetical protein HOV94_24130 [Saccharothrix sp.]|nr:hypothetical protein [Saccharothrix sp.]